MGLKGDYTGTKPKTNPGTQGPQPRWSFGVIWALTSLFILALTQGPGSILIPAHLCPFLCPWGRKPGRLPCRPPWEV